MKNSTKTQFLEWLDGSRRPRAEQDSRQFQHVDPGARTISNHFRTPIDGECFRARLNEAESSRAVGTHSQRNRPEIVVDDLWNRYQIAGRTPFPLGGWERLTPLAVHRRSK